ncbi:MAG: SDR family oxidoreductase [Steroidobacteraceae bacterium]|nr:SDR family oxidoreductase [Nevskiaceae bacterium]
MGHVGNGNFHVFLVIVVCPEGNAMPTALVTGASRGIGLALCEAFAERGWTVVAACRRPDDATALRDLAAAFPGLIEVEALDVSDFAAIEVLSKKLTGRPIDVLVNNAGVASRETQLGSLNYDAWKSLMDINLMAPMKMIEAFLPQVEASGHKKIVAISSSLGSIAATTGGNYFYRTSKAALNMAMRSVARDLALRGVIVSMLSPGYVDTDLTRHAVGGPPKISARDSGQGLADAIIALTSGGSGEFRRFNGQSIDW